jgi:hypothetical protein
MRIPISIFRRNLLPIALESQTHSVPIWEIQKEIILVIDESGLRISRPAVVQGMIQRPNRSRPIFIDSTSEIEEPTPKINIRLRFDIYPVIV